MKRLLRWLVPTCDMIVEPWRKPHAPYDEWRRCDRIADVADERPAHTYHWCQEHADWLAEKHAEYTGPWTASSYPQVPA